VSYCPTEKNLLGQVRFSIVSKGILHDFNGHENLSVAVKRFSKRESYNTIINSKVYNLVYQTKNPNIIDCFTTFEHQDNKYGHVDRFISSSQLSMAIDTANCSYLYFRFIVLEFCVGTLNEVVHGKCEGPPDSLQQITSGLAFLHSLNIAHGNLKPSNILVSFPIGNSPLRLKLTDFGLHHIIKACKGKEIAVFTPEWKAPESIVSPAFDIYSLAKIFCFILSKDSYPAKINLIEFIAFITILKRLNPFTFHCSVEAMLELIDSMLRYEAYKRPTASQVLQHPAFAAVPLSESQQGQKY